jgi:hypothetical protein
LTRYLTRQRCHRGNQPRTEVALSSAPTESQTGHQCPAPPRRGNPIA